MNLEDVIDPEYGLQQDEWSSSKPTFGEEGQLEVIGYLGHKCKNRYYKVKCNKCAKDPELWGDGIFQTWGTSLISGTFPCGCSKAVQWREDQYPIILSRLASNMGYNFISWGRRENSKKDVYVVISCPNCVTTQPTYNTLLANLKKGKRPCKCSVGYRRSDAELLEKFKEISRSAGYEYIGYDVNQKLTTKTKFQVLCRDCAADPEMYGDGVFIAESYDLASGKKPCGCSKKFTYSSIQASIICKRVVLNTKYVFLGWYGKYCGTNKTLCRMYCPDHGEWTSTTMVSLLSGTGCKYCVKLGGQTEAYINWVVGENNYSVAIKFGIAKDSSSRLKTQNRKSPLKIQNYRVYSFEDAESCLAAENECKKILECGVLTKEQMPDGYTETTWAYNIGKVKDIYERNGGVLV